MSGQIKTLARDAQTVLNWSKRLVCSMEETMRQVGAFEAKTHLPELLRRVESGESITITKHGKPVAILVPPREVPSDVKAAIKAMREFREKHGPELKGTSFRELIEEGRRY